MLRLKTITAVTARSWRGRGDAPRRRGLKGQKARRQVERVARKSAIRFLRWSSVSRAEAARHLWLRPSLLSDWEARWREDRLAIRARGRIPERGDRAFRQSFIALFQLLGPRTGLPTLQALFPEIARGELLELQRRYRFAHKRKSQYMIHALRWTRPGAVWAIDFHEPERPVDDRYSYLFIVRDLASGQQLLALPIEDPDAKTAIAALEALFIVYGPPLVLKSDNGSAFIAEVFAAFLADPAREVTHLLSPPGTPEYNGSCEAGIGSIATRAHHESARNDRPGEWTCDDVEVARRQANETARPNGHRGPSPDEAWRAREPITPELRRAFRATCERLAGVVRSEWGIAPDAELDRRTLDAITRVAVGRALVEHDLLLFRRRRITLRI